MNQQQITLPPIKHVFKGLLNTKSTDPLQNRKCAILYL